MKSIKNLVLSSVALFALGNNALAQEILLDKQQLEQEVKQELQLVLETIQIDLEVAVMDIANTDSTLIAQNELTTQKKVTEELAD